MTIHYFNPDHETAMELDTPRCQIPRAARDMRRDLCFLPALWATDGDCVIVDNPDEARHIYNDLPIKTHSQVEFYSLSSIVNILKDNQQETINISPWGWNRALRKTLLDGKVPPSLLPDDSFLDNVRNLSDRSLSANILASLTKGNGIIGEAFECNELSSIDDLLKEYSRIVVKAPWSCSGRGVKYIGNREYGIASDAECAWISNTIKRQGKVMIEPMYDKLLDFAVEMRACSSGNVEYEGLSLFSTNGTAYTGNVLATDEEILQVIGKYIDTNLLNEIRTHLEQLLSMRLNGKYTGPIGIDMMIVRNKNGTPTLHPCVEINLRRTMGMAALSLSKRGERGTMRIVRERNHFTLHIG